MTLAEILASQRCWAESRWPGHVGARAPSLTDNLIMPMDEDVHRQFQGGAGGELGTERAPGKMWSLRSSSALAYNFLAPWRGQDLQPLAEAFGRRIEGPPITFERPFPHGLPPQQGRQAIPPNLDVAIGGQLPLAIECKFTEPYGADKTGDCLKAAYFDGGHKRWNDVGLPECQRLAENLGKELSYHRLDAAQLLKHLLGLAYTTQAAPRLLCLWFDDGSALAHQHRRELEQFGAMLDNCIEFAAVTYQEAFAVLRRLSEPRAGYIRYLEERYFPVAPEA